jgi:hypothetical protein
MRDSVTAIDEGIGTVWPGPVRYFLEIIIESNYNRPMPHRGTMVSVAGHAAPLELERIFGSAVSINMSLLLELGSGRDWSQTGSSLPGRNAVGIKKCHVSVFRRSAARCATTS